MLDVNHAHGKSRYVKFDLPHLNNLINLFPATMSYSTALRVADQRAQQAFDLFHNVDSIDSILHEHMWEVDTLLQGNVLSMVQCAFLHFVL